MVYAQDACLGGKGTAGTGRKSSGQQRFTRRASAGPPLHKFCLKQFMIEMTSSSPPASGTSWVTMLTSDDFLIAAEVLIRSLRAHNTDDSRPVCVLVTPTVGLRARKSLERLGACLRPVEGIPAPGGATLPAGEAISATGHATAATADATPAPGEATAAPRLGASHVPGWDATGYTSTLPPLPRLAASGSTIFFLLFLVPGGLSQSCISGT